ncbi:MAG: four helix bundle protein [Omnitrophica WOR_2 bacterium RIFCSPHIGHO2_02_FULL_48_11]|nr:MAG: four helix bundle protein [Omnitrophica WOR_2 bacterium RIFCSPHIGHO2_02_FULL_48_11]
MKIEKFEDIQAWQEARILVKSLYRIIKNNNEMNKDIRFRSQITSAAISIMSNIAEGFSRKSNKEFAQFLFIAKGSTAEVQSQLYVALDLGYIDEKQFKETYAMSDKIARLVSKFITYLKGAQRTQ